MSLKLTIENMLLKIDAFFGSKSSKDKNMVYIMIIALCFAIAYPLYDLSSDKFKEAIDKITNIEGKINMDKAYLSANPEAKIVKLTTDIAKLESDLEQKKEANRYIKEKIMTISSLVYNEKLWGEYLDSISKNALKHNVKILDFTNKYVQTSSSFGHVLDIDLDVNAPYANTISFINSLEQSDLVVDLHDFEIKAKDKLNSKLKISVWGITYK